MKYQIKQLPIFVKQMHDWPPFAIFAHDVIGHKIMLSGWFEHQLINFLEAHIFPLISPNSIALDIGANIGNHSNRFANYFEKVHAFEPNKRCFYLLQANHADRGKQNNHPQRRLFRQEIPRQSITHPLVSAVQVWNMIRRLIKTVGGRPHVSSCSGWMTICHPNIIRELVS